jgi:hypothetical protein
VSMVVQARAQREQARTVVLVVEVVGWCASHNECKQHIHIPRVWAGPWHVCCVVPPCFPGALCLMTHGKDPFQGALGPHQRATLLV